MKTIKLQNGTEIELTYASQHASSSYGRRVVEVEVMYAAELKTFTTSSTNLSSLDDAKELTGDEMYMSIYEIVENSVIDEITEWIEELL